MIYLDNAATSWPKPPKVIEGIQECILNYCANPGRSAHEMALKSENTVYNCRCKIAELFGIKKVENVIFTHNATHALNIVIKGILDNKSHAVVTSMEHNSVLRPLAVTGAMYDMVQADKFGYVDENAVEKVIKSNTALIICTLSSNVCGSVQPFEKIAKIAKKHNIPFLLDASQGAGSIDIDMTKQGIDFLACPGHKGLLGPTGTGVLCINCDKELKTLMEGGTGSLSKLVTQPFALPDRFESGTLNVAGIAGLDVALSYVLRRSPKSILHHENRLCAHLAENIMFMKGVRLAGYNPYRRRTAVLSVVFDNTDSLTASTMLNVDYSIAVRAGFHCAYTAHGTLGTDKTGTVRFSPGPFTTKDDIKKVTDAIYHIALQKS